MPESLTAGLVDDRLRRVAGVLALLAALAGMVALVGRAVWLGETDPLLVAVRLVVPTLLAVGGHLVARHHGGAGPALLATLALLLAPEVVGDLHLLSRGTLSHPVVVGGFVQSGLGVLAGGLALVRHRPISRAASAIEAPGALRPALIGAIVLLALAQLYPSVTGPIVGDLQPLVAVFGAAAAPSVVAAVAVALVAVLMGRVAPAAGALSLAAVSVITLGQGALQLVDVAAGDVASTPWLWLRLVAATLLIAVAVRLGAHARRPSPAG